MNPQEKNEYWLSLYLRDRAAEAVASLYDQCNHCCAPLVGGEWDLCCECEQQRQAEAD